MNFERVACFDKENSEWNHLEIEEMDSSIKADQLLMEQQA